MIGLGGETRTQCSAAGCSLDAEWAIHWRNPRIHGLDRVKTWLACDQHREHLSGYLSNRSFPVTVTAVGQTVEVVPDGALP